MTPDDPTPAITAPDVLDVNEAAAFLRCAPKTVRGLLRSGKLRGGLCGRVWRVRRRALLDLLDGTGGPPPVLVATFPDRAPPTGRPGRPRKVRRAPAIVRD